MKRKSLNAGEKEPEDKLKLEATEGEHDEADSEQEAPRTVKKPAKYTQKAQESDDSKVQTSSDGEKFVELGKAKRVTVRNFKGSTLIDIREFYTDKETGDAKPGKKGISLTPEQWQELKQATPTLDALVAEISKK